jgi:O-antigen/teichoic acid export membrane protein
VTLVTFASGIVLARTLAPADFGLFAICYFIVTFLAMASDLGLHAALVQQPEPPTERDIQTMFTVQQMATTVAFIFLWLVVEWLPSIYPKAGPDLVRLVRLLSFQLYLISWSRPSEALLERSLRYARLVPIDVICSAVYGTVAIAMALNGFGVWSFAVAFLTATTTRVILVYRAAPWKIRFTLEPSTAAALLGRGVPLQIGRVVAQAQYWVTPTLVAGSIGPAAVGLLQWAAGNGRKPLDVLEYFARVSLPHFSRLQHDEAEVARILSRYVSVFVLICGFWLTVLAIAGRDLVLFVYTDRWLPAVPAMVLFAVVGLLVAVRVVVSAALTGLGRTMVIARVGVATTIATIVVSVPLVLWLGPIGVPLGQLVGAAGVLPFLLAGLGSGTLPLVLRAASTALLPMAVAVVVGAVAQVSAVQSIVAQTMAPTLLSESSPAFRGLFTAGSMTLAYAAVIWLTGPRWLRDSVREELARV